jgi:hypothetical protein
MPVPVSRRFPVSFCFQRAHRAFAALPPKMQVSMIIMKPDDPVEKS